MKETRASFLARLEPMLPRAVMNDIKLAYTISKYGHRAQVRKEKDEHGRPVRYFEHVRRVTLILIDEVGIIRPEMVIAGLVHDCPEDTKDVDHEMVEHCFGADVATIVKFLSKTPPEGYVTRFHLCTDWRPLALKGCDRLDNMRSLDSGSLEFRQKQVAETQEKYFPLFDRMVDMTPKSTDVRPRVIRLRDMVRRETERQATLLDVAIKNGAA
jgi:guanosine-3',5'-bis(diphosphate) 3'-pyrophosphohydrolase